MEGKYGGAIRGILPRLSTISHGLQHFLAGGNKCNTSESTGWNSWLNTTQQRRLQASPCWARTPEEIKTVKFNIWKFVSLQAYHTLIYHNFILETLNFKIIKSSLRLNLKILLSIPEYFIPIFYGNFFQKFAFLSAEHFTISFLKTYTRMACLMIVFFQVE